MPRLSYRGPSRVIGKALKDWRLEKGMTLRGAAQASKTAQQAITFDYLSKLENGLLMPSLPKLAALAEIYQRPMSELFDIYENERLRELVPKRRSYELLRELGIKALDKGEMPKAIACFLGALDAARDSGADRQKLAVAHNNVGGALIRGGRYLTAQRYLEAGLDLVESPHTRGRLLDNLAIVHFHLNNLNLAELLSREATVLAEGDAVLASITRGTRAAILFDLARHAEAEALIRLAIEDHRKAGREAEEIRYMYNLGYCLFEQRKTEEGLAQLRTAAARAAERGDPDLRAKSLYLYGRCLFKASRKDEAGGPLRSSLTLAREHDLRNEAFHCSYYLWQLAREIGSDETSQFLDLAVRYRSRMQQISPETTDFDRRASVVSASASTTRGHRSGTRRPASGTTPSRPASAGSGRRPSA